MDRIKSFIAIFLILISFSAAVIAETINANDDVSCLIGYDSNWGPGLLVKYANWDSYIEFTLGNDTAETVTLNLWADGGTLGDWGVGIYTAELDFDESTYEGAAPSGGWSSLIASFTVFPEGAYQVDLTDWYNTNLGKTMTLKLSTTTFPANTQEAPYFEDSEGGLGTGQPGPYLDVVPAAAAPPDPATNPNPSGTNVPTDSALSWTAGAGAITHDVYFGQTNPPAFQVNQTETTYDPGGLELNTTYYWRIDEVNSYGTTAGTLWSFTTEITSSTTIATGWWRFDESTGSTARDSSANGNDGTLVNMDSSDWVAGLYGNALDFDGADDYVQMPRTSILEDGTQLAAEAWVKTTDLGSEWGNIVGTGDGGWLMARHNNGAIAAFWLSTGMMVIENSTITITDGQWHHIATVYDGSTLHLYVDGNHVSTTEEFISHTTIAPGGTILNMFDNGVLIGENAHETGRLWNGLIDEVKIYNDADEFTYHWNNPDEAWGPTPADGKSGVAVDSELSWSAGDTVISHDVYFGTNETAVTNAQRLAGDNNGDGKVDINDLKELGLQWLTNANLEDFSALAADWEQSAASEYKGNQTSTSFDPGVLDNDATYYWRIDEVTAAGIIPGRIWSFSTTYATGRQTLYESTTGRRYILYVPTDYNPTKAYPLIISSHGTDQNGDTEMDSTGPNNTWDHGTPTWPELVDAGNDVIVACPDMEGAYGESGCAISSTHATQLANDDAAIMAIITEIEGIYNIDTFNIMLTGFSGGGNVVHYVGLLHPDVFKCICARHGNFHTDLVPSTLPPGALDMPVFIFTREQDITCGNDEAIAWYQSADFSSLQTEVYPTIDGWTVWYDNHVTDRQYALDWFLTIVEPVLYTKDDLVFPGTTWQTKTPAELGLNGSKLDQFAAAVGGDGCIIRQGYLVKSWGSVSGNDFWASASKPVTSTLLLYAVEEGLLSDVHELIKDHGWNNMTTEDQTMEFYHLANMTSGYARAEASGQAWAYNDYAIRLYVDTLFDNVYGDTADNVATSANRLGALGFEDGTIYQDHIINGTNYGPSIYASPRDFARIGWFWCNKGYWAGDQLLPRHYFDDYMKTLVPSSMPLSTASDSDYLGVGTYGGGSYQTDYGPGLYGFNWWFNENQAHWPDVPADAFQANGHWGKEVVTVIPSLGLVAAWRMSLYPNPEKAYFEPGNADNPMNQNLKLLVDACPPVPTGSLIHDSDNPAWLTRYGGKHLFMCGPGDPENFLYRGTRNADGTRTGDQMDLINKLAPTGANCIYFQAVKSNGGDGDSYSNPFVDGNVNGQLDEDILNQWETWFTAMDDNGIVIFFMFYDDWANPYGSGDAMPAQEVYLVDSIVDRFKHHKNLIWIVSEEYNKVLSETRVSNIAERIKMDDEYNHPVGTHQLPSTTFNFSDDPNMDQFAMQLNNPDTSFVHQACLDAWNSVGGQKNVNLAEIYDFTSNPITGTPLRQKAWAAAMGGAYSMWLWMDIANTSISDLEICGRLVKFMESTRFYETQPSDNLAYGETDYVLADPGNVYLVYGVSVSSSLGVYMQPSTYHVKWFDPIDGSWSDEGKQTISVAGNQTFAKPATIGSEAVLYLDIQTSTIPTTP